MKKNYSAIAFAFIAIAVTITIITYLFICQLLPLVCSCNESCKTVNILFWIGFLASLGASLLAKDQNDKLKNSTYGGLITTGLSTLVTIINNDKSEKIDYIIYSVLGSVAGILIGWVLYAIVTLWAYRKYNSPLAIIILITSGLDGIKEKIILEENRRLLTSMDSWWKKFAIDFSEEANTLLKFENNENSKEMMIVIIKSLFSSVCNVHNLMYSTDQMRASIIKFDLIKKEGSHWIYFANFSNPFKHEKKLNSQSKAYELVISDYETYRYIDTQKDIKIQNRESEERYRYFSLFKIDGRHILTVDWPNSINPADRDMTIEYFSDPRILVTLKELFIKFDV